MADKKDDKKKDVAQPFPAAVYKNGESKLVNTQEEADAAAAEGWTEDQKPAEPEAGSEPAKPGAAPKDEPPKKKG